MQQCWSEDEKHRPTFDDLVVLVRDVITDMEHRHNEKVTTNVTYINIPHYIPIAPEPRGFTRPEVIRTTIWSPGYKRIPKTTNLMNSVLNGPLTPETEEIQGYLYPSTYSQPGAISTLV